MSDASQMAVRIAAAPVAKAITLKASLKWPDVKDDYLVRYDGHLIGRIRLGDERYAQGTTWEWSITIPMAMPDWAKLAIEEWSATAGIHTGRVFRPVNRGGRLIHESLTGKAIWFVLRKYTAQLGWRSLAPHDLRRTYAQLAHRGGAKLEQIQISLGHASIQTTERYLAIKQDFTNAPCDHLGLQFDPIEHERAA